MGRRAPSLYDLDPRDFFKEDIHFYKTRIARESLVADIGTGTGRIAIALAEHGCRVHGVDYDRCMLAQAVAKIIRCEASIQRQITLECADICQPANDRQKYDVVVVGLRSFAAITGEQRQLSALLNCANLLGENGQIFVSLPLELGKPDPTWEGRTSKDWEITTAGGWIIERHTERLKIDIKQKKHFLKLVYKILTKGGLPLVIEEPLELAHISDTDFRELSTKAGLMVERSFGGYDERPLGLGHEMIYILRRSECDLEVRPLAAARSHP
jgi:2-polyprenyl-3-methyl-5-hydroxy-6-metoxy-1,4-benzoquinol methylase